MTVRGGNVKQTNKNNGTCEMNVLAWYAYNVFPKLSR